MTGAEPAAENVDPEIPPRPSTMRIVLVRIGASAIGVVLTGGYLYSLILLTFGACYMRDATCAGGWIARTIGTAIYLGLVAATILVSRRLLRAAERQATQGEARSTG